MGHLWIPIVCILAGNAGLVVVLTAYLRARDPGPTEQPPPARVVESCAVVAVADVVVAVVVRQVARGGEGGAVYLSPPLRGGVRFLARVPEAPRA